MEVILCLQHREVRKKWQSLKRKWFHARKHLLLVFGFCLFLSFLLIYRARIILRVGQGSRVFSYFTLSEVDADYHTSPWRMWKDRSTKYKPVEETNWRYPGVSVAKVGQKAFLNSDLSIEFQLSSNIYCILVCFMANTIKRLFLQSYNQGAFRNLTLFQTFPRVWVRESRIKDRARKTAFYILVNHGTQRNASIWNFENWFLICLFT